MLIFGYKKIKGQVTFEGEDISNLSTDKIAKKGIFMSFQSPEEILGISTLNFLKVAKKSIEDKPVKIFEFKDTVKKYVDELNMNQKLIDRNLNVGFSGGEKKKNEVLQIKMLKPKLIILDEIDSGLDVDSLKIVAENINEYKKERQLQTSFKCLQLPFFIYYMELLFKFSQIERRTAC